LARRGLPVLIFNVIDELLARNEKYAATFPGPAPLTPALHLAVVACMDSRIDVHGALGLAIGDAHVIRNAGGVVTDDVVRSLVISQRLLGTRQIILIHHTDCGMVKFTDDGLKAEIERDTGIRPPWAMEAFTDLDADVLQSIARLKASPFVPYTDMVRGFVFDIQTGLLREVRLRRVRACHQGHRARRGNPASRGAAPPGCAPRAPARRLLLPARRPCRDDVAVEGPRVPHRDGQSRRS
jgi:carbonic anhydrase